MFARDNNVIEVKPITNTQQTLYINYDAYNEEPTTQYRQMTPTQLNTMQYYARFPLDQYNEYGRGKDEIFSKIIVPGFRRTIYHNDVSVYVNDLVKTVVITFRGTDPSNYMEIAKNAEFATYRRFFNSRIDNDAKIIFLNTVYLYKHLNRYQIILSSHSRGAIINLSILLFDHFTSRSVNENFEPDLIGTTVELNEAIRSKSSGFELNNIIKYIDQVHSYNIGLPLGFTVSGSFESYLVSLLITNDTIHKLQKIHRIYHTIGDEISASSYNLAKFGQVFENVLKDTTNFERYIFGYKTIGTLERDNIARHSIYSFLSNNILDAYLELVKERPEIIEPFKKSDQPTIETFVQNTTGKIMKELKKNEVKEQIFDNIKPDEFNGDIRAILTASDKPAGYIQNISTIKNKSIIKNKPATIHQRSKNIKHKQINYYAVDDKYKVKPVIKKINLRDVKDLY